MDNYEKLKQWVTERSKHHDASHDMIHILNVVHNTKMIMDSEENINSSTYKASVFTALCHEVCDKKYVDSPQKAIQELKTFLNEIGTEQSVMECICNVVPSLSFSRRMERGTPLFRTDMEQTVYLIVSDADMLESLGAIGMLRTYMYQAHKGSSCEDAYKHVTERLFHCIEYMHHTFAQEEGLIRFQRMQRICNELCSERKFIE